MKSDRLLAILLLLQRQGKMSVRELAEQLEVSERTVQRDLESLGVAGVPVYAARGSGGGWMLAEGYRTDLTGLKADELQSLLFAHSARWVGDLGLAGSLDSALRKLQAALPAETRREADLVRKRLHIDGAGWQRTAEAAPLLPVVQEAVWTEQVLRIRYKRDGAEKERDVYPLGLVAKRDVWYLVADTEVSPSCLEPRTYRLSRLTDAVALGETFARPAAFDLAAYWEQSTEQFIASLPRYPARIRIVETSLDRLKRERYATVLGHTAPAAPVCEGEPGWIEADVQFHTLESAQELLLGYGAAAEALAPAELRERMAATAQQIAALYAQPMGLPHCRHTAVSAPADMPSG